ncbi:MAG TPA: PBP1A family penicillin-binding protein [Longimicrobiales bacterium]|nr:PBP1A family penicillin-binding protein [Longimicrobiales bacterium]
MKARLLAIILVPISVAATAAGVVLGGGLGNDCPSVDELRNYRPPEATRVFAADGSLLADLSPQRRIVVDLDAVPTIVRDGFVAVEDRRFWEHSGVDLHGVARALWRNATSLSLREGFSTIPMQLVRNVFPEELPRSEKFGRKLCEIRLARQLDRHLTKAEVLELYLNQIYMGEGLYGVEAAARGYFGKPVRAVSPAEAALLVGLIKNPAGYNPRRHPARAIRRRNTVLDVMAREGVIDPETAERAKAEPLRLAPPLESAGPAPYVVAAIRRELRTRFGPDADIRGLRVYTSIDPELQRAAQEALTAQIRRIESGAYGEFRGPRPADGGPTAADSATGFLQGMFIAIDPRDGGVRAAVGGRDFAHSQFDRAFQARRQPGSAFKPILYAAAVQQGIPVTTRIPTTPVAVSNANAQVWRPADHTADTVGALSMREALAISSNSATVRLGTLVGESRVIQLARDLGLSTPIPPYPSIFLGSAEVVPAELVAAYAAFANGGYRIEPRLFHRVEDSSGRVLWEASPPRQRVLDEGTAYLVLDMLEDVVDHGTAASVRSSGFWLPAAGKTGTTNDGKDAWFIGMTPDLVAGVWIGFDQPRPIVAGASGGRLAAPAWAAFMKTAYRTRPAPPPWTPPASLVSLPVDALTGHAATRNCPPEQVRIEYFLPGTAPDGYCPLHPPSALDRFFGRIWRGLRDIF